MTLYRSTPCEHGHEMTCDHVALESRAGACLRLDCNVLHGTYCPGGSRAEVIIDYEAADAELNDWIPCVCTDDYKDRDLEDPRCRHHDAQEALAFIIDAALAGRIET